MNDLTILDIVLRQRRKIMDLEAEIERLELTNHITPDMHLHWKQVHSEYLSELKRLGF